MENEDTQPVLCTACGGGTNSLGQVPLRTKGTGGAAKLLFGEWAELGEEMWPIDIFRCMQCGHLELYDLDFSLRSN